MRIRRDSIQRGASLTEEADASGGRASLNDTKTTNLSRSDAEVKLRADIRSVRYLDKYPNPLDTISLSAFSFHLSQSLKSIEIAYCVRCCCCCCCCCSVTAWSAVAAFIYFGLIRLIIIIISSEEMSNPFGEEEVSGAKLSC